LSNLRDGAWGGGNQFQSALRKFLCGKNIYTEKISQADVILVNSHHWGERLKELYTTKRNNPDVIILHRIDGPVSIVRNDSRQFVIDKCIMDFNTRIADGTVFQSEWSKTKCIEQGMDKEKISAVIYNAPDPSIFYPTGYRVENKKFSLVAASWSTNERKGFDIYKYLDENLDFSRYEFTFVGNSPLAFRNIQHKPVMNSKELAAEYHRHDLFVHPSYMESCSNALIEAMHCGLVPVAMNNTSHPEIVKYDDLLFEGKKDILIVIENVCNDLDFYRKRLCPLGMDETGKKYIEFAENIRDQYKNSKKISWIDFLFVLASWHFMLYTQRVNTLIDRFTNCLK